MNEFILSLLRDLNEQDQDNVLDCFYQIAFLSSTVFSQNSIFLDHPFFLDLIKYYLYQLQIEIVFTICHNIITDSYFNTEMFNIIIESKYIPYLINNYNENVNFLKMINMLIYKAYHLSSEHLHIFIDTIPFLVKAINSKSNEERFFAIDSLCYLLVIPECLILAKENELVFILEKSLSFSNSQLFGQSLILINLVHSFDKSLFVQNAEIASMVIRHLEYVEDHQTHIMIDYLRALIQENSQIFFELNTINELLYITNSCSFRKKKEIIFFFAQSFSIIFKRYSQIPTNEYIEETDIVFHNTMIHDIISSIMEACLSFNDDKCLFCLSVINNYFEYELEDALLAANESSFHQTLLDLANNTDDSSSDTSFFAQYLLSSFFADYNEKQIENSNED